MHVFLLFCRVKSVLQLCNYLIPLKNPIILILWASKKCLFMKTVLHSKYRFFSKDANQTDNTSSVLVHCLKQYPAIKCSKGWTKNVRGIGNNNKKKETLTWLRNKKQSVIFLQKVHCTEVTIGTWRSELGYKALKQLSRRLLCNYITTILNLIFWKPFRNLPDVYIVCDIKTDEKKKLFTLFTFMLLMKMTRPF